MESPSNGEASRARSSPQPAYLLVDHESAFAALLTGGQIVRFLLPNGRNTSIFHLLRNTALLLQLLAANGLLLFQLRVTHGVDFGLRDGLVQLFDVVLLLFNLLAGLFANALISLARLNVKLGEGLELGGCRERVE